MAFARSLTSGSVRAPHPRCTPRVVRSLRARVVRSQRARRPITARRRRPITARRAWSDHCATRAVRSLRAAGGEICPRAGALRSGKGGTRLRRLHAQAQEARAAGQLFHVRLQEGSRSLGLLRLAEGASHGADPRAELGSELCDQCLEAALHPGVRALASLGIAYL